MSVSSDSDNMIETSGRRISAPAARLSDGRINILLVDDEAKNLTVLETILNDPGYRLVCTGSADQALLALVSEEFALLILDIQMPGMTGFELAQMIKKRRKTAGVPIIFLTAHYSDSEHVLEGYGSGAVDYLHKPVNPAILRSKVAVFAALHRSTREAERANLTLLSEVAERRRIEAQLLQLNDELEDRVKQRTSELLIANAKMRENEELLRLAQEAGQVGIWSWDLRTGTGQWTRAAWNIYDPDAVTSDVKFAQWLAYLHPDDMAKAVRAIDEAKTSGRYWDELRVIANDAQTKWIELVGAVEYDGDEPIRIRGTVRDLTYRKVLELELKEAHRRKDEFLATLAHELRNPLSAISNSLQVLKASPLMAASDEQVTGIMERQIHQLVRLVDDLMDVSRVIRGKIELRRENVELAMIVAASIETAQPLITEKRHTLDISLPAESLLVNADPVRLTQVIGNLLANAAKYTELNGHIRLFAERESNDVVLHIRDTGIGIASEMLSRIFDLFVQVDQAAERSQGGLGIGLTLVRNLVEMHNGQVIAKSDGIGKGSEFLIRLPVAAVHEVPANDVCSPPASPARESCHRLLVVDDNKDAAFTLAMLLELKGHEVRIANNGTSALELATTFLPEVVFLDLGMPGMGGLEVAALVRKIPGLQNAVLVALTGWGQEGDRRRTADAGFNHHIVKPAEVAQLESILAGIDQA